MKYLAPGRAPLMTSSSSIKIPRPTRRSLSVTAHATPDINRNVNSAAENDRPGIRKPMMLQIASGIRSSGKPTMDIGRAFLEQDNQSGSSGADQIPPEDVHTCSETQAKVNPTAALTHVAANRMPRRRDMHWSAERRRAALAARRTQQGAPKTRRNPLVAFRILS